GAGGLVAGAAALPPGTFPTAGLLQSASAEPAPAARMPYAVSYEGHLSVRSDRTATELFTKRIKILAAASIQSLSQQQLLFIEGMQTLETVEAFTEKADGTRVPVDPAGIITRDAASGLQATYARDLKQRTIIFPDVAVGDTIVMTYKREILQGLFPGHFFHADIFPRSQAIASARIIVEAPASVDLQVRTTGTGL